jgi:hypothetical protein
LMKLHGCSVLRQVAAVYTVEPCVAPSGLGRSWSFTKEGEGDLGDCQRPHVDGLGRCGRLRGRYCEVRLWLPVLSDRLEASA